MVKKKQTLQEEIDNALSIDEDIALRPVGQPIHYAKQNVQVKDEEIEDIEAELTKQITGNKNESKELFENKNIRTRTDLSDVEIVYATKLRFMAVKYNLPIYDLILQEFMEMRLSRKRKSRGEYIESLKQKMQQFMPFGNGGMNGLQ